MWRVVRPPTSPKSLIPGKEAPKETYTGKIQHHLANKLYFGCYFGWQRAILNLIASFLLTLP